MAKKPTYKELEQRIAELEKKSSKRKPAREALGEFLEFKEKIISESPIGMSIYDSSGQCVAANDSIGRIIGATREQALEQNYNNIESWKKSGMLDKAKSAIRKNSKKRHELIVKSTFGKDVSLDCHLVPFLSEGQMLLLVMINDITERIRAEERVEEQLRFLQTLIDALPTPIFYKDKDGKYTGCNKAFEEFVGRPREKIIGKTVYDMGPKRIADKYYEKDRELFQNPGKQVYEWKVNRKSGELREVVFNKATFTDADGKVAGLIGGISDITERKRAEEALREREAALKAQTRELEEVNSALTVLLKRREEDKTEVEERVLLNVKELVVPYAEKLKKTSLEKKQMAYLNVLESNLNNIISPFTYRLSSKALGFTPKEIHVANLVMDGKTAKEIAGLFNVSVRTIEFHRRSIRTKIGLKNSKVNLRSRLLSM